MAAKKSGFSDVKIKKKAKKVVEKKEVVVEEPTIEPVTVEVPNTTPEAIGNPIEEEVLVPEVLEKPVGMKRVKRSIVGNGTETVYKAPTGTIKFEAQVAPIPMFLLPKEIQSYLIKKGFGTNVWKKDKEWLERHGADMEVINKLKAFLSSRS